jgi:hypothetical protein
MTCLEYNGKCIASINNNNPDIITDLANSINTNQERAEIIPEVPSFGIVNGYHPNHPSHTTPSHPKHKHHVSPHNKNKIVIPSPLKPYNVPVKIINNIELGNAEVYIVVKGLNTQNNACYLDVTATPFVCQEVNANSKSQDFSFTLNILPQDSDGNLLMYLPILISARMYISISQALSLTIGTDAVTGESTIDDPDGFNTNDPNYYILYDKIEFDYQKKGGLYVDATAVDFFGLPIEIEDPGSVSSYKKSGAEIDRTSLFTTINQQLCNNNFDPTWCNLLLKYDGYMIGNKAEKLTQILRVSAPGKSMTTGNGDNTLFDPIYLDRTTGFSYFSFLKDYYSPSNSRFIKIDCSELRTNSEEPIAKYIYTGIISADNFIFNNEDNSNTITIAFPESISFFAGAVGSFNYPNDTPGAVIVKFLTAAFDVGLLPTINENDVLSSAYLQSYKDRYYTNNPHFPGDANNTGPWYDLYAKTIHEYVSSALYAFAYDDALGNDGTLNDQNAQKPSTLTITLQELGTSQNIPNPYYDPNQYTLNIILGGTTNCPFPLIINGQKYASSSSFTLTNQKIPFDFQFFNNKYALYIQPNNVIPYDGFSDGITISLTGEDATISFPGLSNSC